MLRVASLTDVPALVCLINAAFRVEAFFVSGERTNAPDIEARINAPDSAFLVIDGPDANDLAGAVHVDVRHGRGHFAMLAVHPDWQGHGHGRALVEAAEAFCRDAGCHAVDIDVVNVREELPGFYTRLGYVPVATAPFPDPDKLHLDAHMVIMTKEV